MIVVWKHRDVNMDVLHDYNQQVVVIICSINEVPWLLFGTYASTNYRIRRVLWAEASWVVDQGFPSLNARDFNYINRP